MYKASWINIQSNGTFRVHQPRQWRNLISLIFPKQLIWFDLKGWRCSSTLNTCAHICTWMKTFRFGGMNRQRDSIRIQAMMALSIPSTSSTWSAVVDVCIAHHGYTDANTGGCPPSRCSWKIRVYVNGPTQSSLMTSGNFVSRLKCVSVLFYRSDVPITCGSSVRLWCFDGQPWQGKFFVRRWKLPVWMAELGILMWMGLLIFDCYYSPNHYFSHKGTCLGWLHARAHTHTVLCALLAAVFRWREFRVRWSVVWINASPDCANDGFAEFPNCFDCRS